MGDTKRHVVAQISTPNSGDERRWARAANRGGHGGDDQDRQHDGVGQDAVRQPIEHAPEILIVDDGEVAGTTGLEDGLRPIGLR